jgi:hypothetical protein
MKSRSKTFAGIISAAGKLPPPPPPPRASRHLASVSSPALGCRGCFSSRFEKVKADPRVRYTRHIFLPQLPQRCNYNSVSLCQASSRAPRRKHEHCGIHRLLAPGSTTHPRILFEPASQFTHHPPRRRPPPLPCVLHPAAPPPHLFPPILSHPLQDQKASH